jgi:aminoglycoside/choline kinase family phosphotransferase
MKKNNTSKIKKILRVELNKIYKKLKYKNDTFVHRDFHVSNIMYHKKKLGVIDSQDALIGNPLYDVASLIDDVRIKLHPALQNKLFNYYFKTSKLKKENIQNLKNDFDILSVQRNLKILGIFVRLHKRDGKSNYLKYLPYTWSLINRRLKNSVFKDFNILINKILPINDFKNLKKI